MERMRCHFWVHDSPLQQNEHSFGKCPQLTLVTGMVHLELTERLNEKWIKVL
jgi:hypothetical protein